jgi:hypothetical protein
MFEEAVWYILLPLWSPDDFKLNPLLSTPPPPTRRGGGLKLHVNTCSAEEMQKCKQTWAQVCQCTGTQEGRLYYTHQTNNPPSTFLAKICFSISWIFTQQKPNCEFKSIKMWGKRKASFLSLSLPHFGSRIKYLWIKLRPGRDRQTETERGEYTRDYGPRPTTATVEKQPVLPTPSQ